MAENKKSIIVYADWIELFESLTDDEAGKLIKHFFRYVNDKNPTAPDRITELSFIPIKQSLKRDLEKWEDKLSERSINGRKGNLKKYDIDIYNEYVSGKYSLEEAEDVAKRKKDSHSDKNSRIAIKNVAKVADSVSVSVNDSVSVSVNNNNNNTASPFSFYNSLINYGFDKKLVSEWLSVRKTKKATNSETAFNSFIKEVEKTNGDINDILSQCVVNSWSGFKSGWYNKENSLIRDVKKKYSVQNAFGRDVVYLTDLEYQEKSKQGFNNYKLIE